MSEIVGTSETVYLHRNYQEDESKFWMHFFFFLTSILVTVTLLNLLVGILSTNYASELEKPLFQRERARILCAYLYRPYIRYNFQKRVNEQITAGNLKEEEVKNTGLILNPHPYMWVSMITSFDQR